jgi:hypothetical protein
MKSTKSNIRTYMNMNTQPLNKVSTKIWGVSKLKVHTIKNLRKLNKMILLSEGHHAKDMRGNVTILQSSSCVGYCKKGNNNFRVVEDVILFFNTLESEADISWNSFGQICTLK